MKIFISSLSKKQRQRILHTCVTVPDALLKYLTNHTTTRCLDANVLYTKMIDLKVPFDIDAFYEAVKDAHWEMRFRGIWYGKPHEPKRNHAEIEKFKAKIHVNNI
jgi:hypothetical protein